MAFKDLRDYLNALKKRGELIEINEEVSTELEITEIADRSFKNQKNSKTLIFNNVKNHTMPVVINLYATENQTAFAMGVEKLDDIAERIRSFTQLQPPKSLTDKINTVLKLAEFRKFAPKLIKNAPVQEIVLIGNDIDLTKIPVLKCWPDDGGPFITLTAVVSKDPVINARNIGMYRVQIFDKKTAGLHWQRHKGGAAHHEKYKKNGGKMEVAVVLGSDPVTIYSASAPLPPNIDEWFFSGFLRKERVEIVKCKTVDLEVPAHAEIVLEGYVDLNEPLRVEGPFGDHTGFYSLADLYPAFHITAITMRKNPIYPTTIVGIPPVEDVWLGKITERAFLPLMQVVMPEIRDYAMPSEGVFHNLVFIAAKKSYPGHAWKFLHGGNGLGLMMLTKVMAVVDESVDVQNAEETWRSILKNADFSLDVVESRGPIDALDHASQYFTYAGKLLLDGTTKWDGEGRKLSDIPKPDKEKNKLHLENLTKELSSRNDIFHWSIPYYRSEDDDCFSPLFISILKEEAGQGREILDSILKKDFGNFNKFVIVVDHDTDLTNPYETWWIALNHLDPIRDVVRFKTEIPFAGYRIPGYHPSITKMGWDSTSKLDSEQFERDWPWKVVMPDTVKRKVDQLWSKMGIS